MSIINFSKFFLKEILKLFLSLFSNLQLKRDATISTSNETISKLVRNEEFWNCQKYWRIWIPIFSEPAVYFECTETSYSKKMKSIEIEWSKEVASLNSNIDNNSQYERKYTLILSCPNLPNAVPIENCKLIVQDLVRREANLNINPSDISIFHWIGRKSCTLPDKRNIIFKLSRRDLVNEIFSACKQIRSSFFLHCFLTPTRSKVLYALRASEEKVFCHR